MADPVSNYQSLVLREYRQKIMRVFLLISIVLLIFLTIINFIDMLINPTAEWVVPNLRIDLLAFASLLILWKLNEGGFAAVAGLGYTILLLAIIPSSYSLPFANYTFIVLALPVLLAGFVIHPWMSLLYAFVFSVTYVLVYFLSGKVFIFDYFSILALLAIALGSFVVANILNQSIQDLVTAYDETIRGWAMALEMHDSETLGHSERVVELTLKLAKKMGIKDLDLVHIRRGVLLHDFGKMAIPDAILHKQGPLSPQEWEVMRQHPILAYQFLSNISFLKPAINIPYCHHERWDGTGYPQGLKGESIPLAARIFAVVDVWDALTADRDYRKSWSREEALTYIESQSGTHFDPRIVKVFISMMQQ